MDIRDDYPRLSHTLFRQRELASGAVGSTPLMDLKRDGKGKTRLGMKAEGDGTEVKESCRAQPRI